MRRTGLVSILLLGTAFGLASWIEPWFQSWAGSRSGEADLLATALGDSRRLFATHIYAKADAYFHNGYYPSIFDYNKELQGNHLGQRIGLSEGAAAHTDEEEDHEGHDASYLGEPHDWIDRFSRNFYPSRHTHLGDPATCTDPDHHHDEDQDSGHEHHDHGPGEPCEHEAAGSDAAKEILPWLKFSAGLDPNRVETYVVAAYWLRRDLGKPDEAEQFLREGLRRNPRNEEILFELGRIYFEERKDADRARNVWELGLRSWREHQTGLEEPNIFLYAQLLGHLAKLEEQEQNYARAIQVLGALAEVSPHRESILVWIEDLRSKLAAQEQGGA